jgi:hypothetical protein
MYLLDICAGCLALNGNGAWRKTAGSRDRQRNWEMGRQREQREREHRSGRLQLVVISKVEDIKGIWRNQLEGREAGLEGGESAK